MVCVEQCRWRRIFFWVLLYSQREPFAWRRRAASDWYWNEGLLLTLWWLPFPLRKNREKKIQTFSIPVSLNQILTRESRALTGLLLLSLSNIWERARLSVLESPGHSQHETPFTCVSGCSQAKISCVSGCNQTKKNSLLTFLFFYFW